MSASFPPGIRRKGRYFEVRDSDGSLICLTVYRRGAQEVLRRLGGTKVLDLSEQKGSETCHEP